jgi:predicted Fe-Mo cluster-binding NifX family protein
VKVAVATDNGMVAGHFGRCPEYTLADVDAGQITGSTVIPNPGHEPGFLPRFLAGKQVNAIICGGMGPRAQQLFADENIEVWMGVAGPVAAVIADFAAGRLARGVSTCDHGPEEHGESHQCRHGHGHGE